MPSSGSVPINPAYAYGNHYFGTFVQDDWRVSGKLTLSVGPSLGLRIAGHGAQQSGRRPFDLTATSPIQVVDPLQPGLTEKGGITFTGSGNRRPYAATLNNFQPRVGLAWHPTAKTVVRAGYGFSYLATFTPPSARASRSRRPTSPAPMATSRSPATRSPIRIPRESSRPPAAGSGLSTFLGQSVTFVDPNRVDSPGSPILHRHAARIALRSVVGSCLCGQPQPGAAGLAKARRRHLGATLAVRRQRLAQSYRQSAQPFAGLLPATNLNGATTTRQQLLLPYPQFTGVTETNLPVGKSWYNSLQVRFDKRLSHGLNLLVSYTHAKWLSATSYLNTQEGITDTPERTLNATDTPNRIVISGNWALPIFTNTKGVLGVFLHGWQANGIFMRENGFPIAAPGGFWPSGINPALPNANDSKFFNTCTQLTSGTLQNCTFNGQTCRWPSFSNIRIPPAR